MLPSRRFLLGLCAFAMAVGLPGLRVQAQGFLVDRRPQMPVARTYEVREVLVDARVKDQVAEVQVSQTFHNPGSTPLEAEYLFPLPEDGAIQNFVLMVDGRELPGRLLPKEEARRIYEEIVRRKKDPALLEYMGRGLIRTSVFPIPAQEDRKVTLRYTKICPRDRDLVTFEYPFATQKLTAKPIDRLALTIRLDTKEPIKSLYSPSHDVEIKRSGDHQATVKFLDHHVVPTTDFRLIYTLAEGKFGASVLSYRPSGGEDGYFLLLASPEVRKPDEKPRPKNVLFVLDRSGSMSGNKIEQAKGALKFVLDNLREEDTFNIIVYDDRVETYKPELQRVSRDSREEARRFVENIYPGGSTNIDEALKVALDQLRDRSRPNYVLFLTDGLPTAGETREMAIADHVRRANDLHARLFAFGVGFDVNARLLDRLSGGNGGTSEYVKPDENIEAHVSRFYAKLTSPVLTDIRVEFAGTDINRTYPRDLPDLFDGGQLLWVGRYRDSGPKNLTISGKVGDDRQTLTVEVDLAQPGEHRDNEFVARLWAMRRVGFLIDQIDLHGQSKELTDELVELSKRFGILTPYTSFLADERVELSAAAANIDRAAAELRQLEAVTGPSGVAQRAAKGDYQLADNAVPSFARGAKKQAEILARVPGLAQPAGAPGAGRSAGGGIGGMGGLMGLPASNAQVVVTQDVQGRTQIVANVRLVGEKTFFRKGDRWIDSTVTPELEAKAIDIEQFSDQYFDLARSQSAERNQYLTFEEPVTINLGGQVYRIHRARN